MTMHLHPDSQGEHDEPLLEMNTTPLIDVLLVLLVMLIITIPIQLHSVHLNLPKAVVSTPEVKPSIIKIEIDASNQTIWNGVTLASKELLQAKLDEAAKAGGEQPEIHIKPSDSAKYDAVAAVLAASQRAGLKKIGIVSAAP